MNIKNTRISENLNITLLTSINGHNSATNKQKITGNNPNLNFVNVNVYSKFGEILSICSPDIKRKQNTVIN